ASLGVPSLSAAGRAPLLGAVVVEPGVTPAAGEVEAEQPVMLIGVLLEDVSPLWLANAALTGALPHFAGVLTSALLPPSRTRVKAVARIGGRLSKVVVIVPSGLSCEMPMSFCCSPVGSRSATRRNAVPETPPKNT